MKTQLKSLTLIGTVLLTLWGGRLHAQFDRITAGAVSSAPDTKLTFANGASYDITSGYIHPLVYTIVTNFSLTNVIYSSTNLQFWALSNQVSGGAAMGSYIVCEVLSVAGPAGGVLNFWEQGWRTPTFQFPVGVPPTVGSNRFDVSDIGTGAGLVDGQPAGSIPGRRFTVNLPGTYAMTVKLFDTSTNTPSGGPMHTPSDPITIAFATGLDLAFTRIAPNTNAAGAMTLTFKQSALTNVLVEASTNLTLNDWMVIGGPFASAPALNNPTTLIVTNPATIAAQFYRLRGMGP